jgi:CIC family chloride channel protein
VIIVLELTGDYDVILPLMFAIVVATTLSNLMTSDTIYTLKLRRRGIDVDAPPDVDPLAHLTAGDAMGTPPGPVPPEQPLDDLIARFAGERADSLPVIDADGNSLGVIAAVDVEDAVREKAPREPVAAGSRAKLCCCTARSRSTTPSWRLERATTRESPSSTSRTIA